MNLKDLTLRVAVLKVLADEVNDRLREAKDEAHAAFLDTGTSSAIPSLPDGFKVAKASLANEGGKSVSVISDRAFLEWVSDNYPGEIVTSVRDSFKKKLLDAVKKEGVPVDPATGEVIPGLRVGPSTPYVRLQFQDGGRAAIATAWRAGKLRDIDLVTPLGIEGNDAA